jgi:hypothetical protein
MVFVEDLKARGEWVSHRERGLVSSITPTVAMVQVVKKCCADTKMRHMVIRCFLFVLVFTLSLTLRVLHAYCDAMVPLPILTGLRKIDRSFSVSRPSSAFAARCYS